MWSRSCAEPPRFSPMPERFKFRKPPGKLPKREGRPNSWARGYTGAAWEALRLRVLTRDNWQCRHCGRVASNRQEAHCDHIVPKTQGGKDEESNLQCLCSACHARKTNRERQEGA